MNTIITNENSSELMQKFADQIPNPPKVEDTVEGPVISKEKSAIYIDLHPYGTGIIYGREFIIARDMIRKLRVGDSVSAKVVDTKNKDGYIELSLKEAKQALVWNEVEEAIKNKTPLEIMVIDANKGGLLMSWQGLQGFLPASQLNAEHYPRVEDGNKMKILEELKQLVGQKLTVTIIGSNTEDGKLVFSEKGINGNAEVSENEISNKGALKENIKKYSVGDILDGEVTGVVEFGIFVKVNDSLEGLVHISEIDWALVEDPKMFYKVGDKVQVKVIEVKNDKISLSIKALKENPWVTAANKYKKDQEVRGVVIKYNKHGALVSVEEGVAGLVHISEFENESKLKDTLELGKSYNFKINIFEAKNQRMTLSLIK